MSDLKDILVRAVKRMNEEQGGRTDPGFDDMLRGSVDESLEKMNATDECRGIVEQIMLSDGDLGPAEVVLIMKIFLLKQGFIENAPDFCVMLLQQWLSIPSVKANTPAISMTVHPDTDLCHWSDDMIVVKSSKLKRSLKKKERQIRKGETACNELSPLKAFQPYNQRGSVTMKHDTTGSVNNKTSGQNKEKEKHYRMILSVQRQLEMAFDALQLPPEQRKTLASPQKRGRYDLNAKTFNREINIKLVQTARHLIDLLRALRWYQASRIDPLTIHNSIAQKTLESFSKDLGISPTHISIVSSETLAVSPTTSGCCDKVYLTWNMAVKLSKFGQLGVKYSSRRCPIVWMGEQGEDEHIRWIECMICQLPPDDHYYSWRRDAPIRRDEYFKMIRGYAAKPKENFGRDHTCFGTDLDQVKERVMKRAMNHMAKHIR